MSAPVAFLWDFLSSFWQVMLDLSPSLLFGLLIAGLMHVYLPTGLIRRGLSRPDMTSVVRGSLIGVPLTLCSCGVIPTAIALRNDGASKGATTAFMISTPQVGVDSVLVTAAFFGWPFALFKVIAAFVTGLIGGALVNRLTAAESSTGDAVERVSGEVCGAAAGVRPSGPGAVWRYAVFDLLAAIDLWIVAGVVVAVLITVALPGDYFASQSWSQGIWGMLVVLAIALPLYVCTTGSVPIAASLIASGLPLGSALVFLMAGPATNVATFGAVSHALGARILSIYLATVVVMSIVFGLLFDSLLSAPGPTAAHVHVHGEAFDWLGTLCAVLLSGLLILLSARRVRARTGSRRSAEASLALQVRGMSCSHCVGRVKQALESIAEVVEAEPDLASGLVRVRGGRLDVARLVSAVEQAGFRVDPAPDVRVCPVAPAAALSDRNARESSS
jgi:uncharacterized membrane protein YraQ (UPF0718 family)/copper chaperone CopZ